MPLAYESKLLKKLAEEQERKALNEAYEAAKPFLDYWMRERDRLQRRKRPTGRCVSFPFFHGRYGLWEIHLPWNPQIMQEDAAKWAAEREAEANKAVMDVITGKARPGWLRRILDRIGSGEDLGPDDCPRCKGTGYLGPITALNVCPKCNGEGWIDEDEDGEA